MRIEVDINGNVTEHEDAPIIEQTAEEILQSKLNESQYLLDSTDFKFNEDYDLKYTPEWEELKIKRQKAREFIRANK